MVKAELSYNPYLLETKILFNGQEPRISSLVEKYQEGKLQSWVKKIPEVFCDEMNGYNFDLDFSGTVADFEDLKTAFGDAVPLEESVRLFLKNELEDSHAKSKGIEELLNWLEVNPNRKFDYKVFRTDNEKLFEDPYTFILVLSGAGNIDASVFNGRNITIENVNGIDEFPSDVFNTPILFYIDEKNTSLFREILRSVQRRKDISREQLFFNVDPSLDSNQVKRIIHDFGIENPQLVDSIDDGQIMKYIELYPVTDYICKAINIFRIEIDKLSSVLEIENEKSRIQNLEIHEKIDALENILENLKRASDQFIGRDNFEPPPKLHTAKTELGNRIQEWRKRKIKISNDADALKAATEYDRDLKSFFEQFLTSVKEIAESENQRILERFQLFYSFARYEDHYSPGIGNVPDISKYYAPDLKDNFMEFREKVMVTPPSLLPLKKLTSEPIQLIPEITYRYKDWRDKATEAIIPIASSAVSNISDSLRHYYDALANDFLEHLKRLIEKHSQEKETVTARLSAEEKNQQADNDWHVSFKDKLRAIERE